MAFYVIFMVVCLMFFAGRIYELLNLTDFTTGFLSAKGIVANPLTVALIVLVRRKSANMPPVCPGLYPACFL